jgi:hypothetical protein
VLEIDERIGRPERGTQLFAAEEGTWTLEQAEQDGPRVFLQGDPHARLSELSRVERQLEMSKSGLPAATVDSSAPPAASRRPFYSARIRPSGTRPESSFYASSLAIHQEFTHVLPAVD